MYSLESGNYNSVVFLQMSLELKQACPYRLTKESGHILLEGVPAGYEIQCIAEDLERHFDYLTAVHHIHLWAISEDQVMMTLHAKTDLGHINDATLSEIKQYLLRGTLGASCDLAVRDGIYSGAVSSYPYGRLEHGSCRLVRGHSGGLALQCFQPLP